MRPSIYFCCSDFFRAHEQGCAVRLMTVEALLHWSRILKKKEKELTKFEHKIED